MAAKKQKRKLTDQQQKCMDCQDCCEYIEFPVTMLSIEIMEYFTMRGEQFYIDNAGVLMVRSKNPCKHLNAHGCDIYKDRPYACRKYMCNEKDKTIKENKDRICAECLEDVSTKIAEFKGGENARKG